ncbi:type II toxin-antitoxin system RelE/ParE family toxin [Agrobacterium radiobacter]|uniref:Plasmid stabilization system protein n=1 Tax=Agrobacterium tumefaciens str. B6 TaxID=1183423 RepID=A0A822V392_AGRTU|nr:type II toxin-antitoxin system RelE/ParE family toxin [Agrobacterium tumefaciens]KWT89188.1 plasmid stabilization protein [Agrobacterium tumefaciens str. B6]MQB24148.1 type II toxin-antitoxin system RelE/ParE family toxin [Agrobacterium tumefaciens]NTA04024.1 type II toxin-antitoxin system RelE/ParE family toxin [Agrobacterium tumefaciens]NTA90616.1 type II toxin-antitoxin system RelE/ParE family toxin [Agrobacterium tumefaciens]NTB11766.1 type II toxin-antitoxin system RelE/ParE family tox
MTIKLVWTPRARSDVKKIYVDIGKSQPLAAERYFARFRAKAESLIDHPHLGERHTEIFPSARMLIEAPYVILYETVPDTNGDEIRSVEIVRVIDGRRDLRTLF